MAAHLKHLYSWTFFYWATCWELSALSTFTLWDTFYTVLSFYRGSEERQEAAELRRPKQLSLWLTLNVHCVYAIHWNLLQRWMHVEQVGYKGHVEFAVSRGDVMRRNELSAVQPGCLSQHQLSPSVQITLLHTHRKQTYMCSYIIICPHLLLNEPQKRKTHSIPFKRVEFIMGHLALSQWQTDSRSGRSCQFWCLNCSCSLHGEQSGPAGRSRLASPGEVQHKQGVNLMRVTVRMCACSEEVP